MSKILIVLVALFAISQAANLRSTISDLELMVSSNGIISLTYVPGAGYVLPVDLSRNARAASNFIVSLYSSNTLFASNCFQFKSYPCNKQFDFCKKDTMTKTYVYPTFTAEGTTVSTQAYVDYSAWALATNAPTIFATNCVAPTTESFGANTVGLLGLGFEGTAQGNFINMVSSFAIQNQGGIFKLAFNPNVNFNKNVRAKVRTDANWRVPNIQAFKYNTDSNPLTGTSLIFDINQDSIGLPVPLYTAFIGLLRKYGVMCPSVYTTPICNYAGQTSFLPNIEFVVDANTKIEITPQMYALNAQNGVVTLNLKGISPQMTGINYVTQPYQYTIVLGNTVLGGYYTYFNANDRSVSLIQVL